MYVEVKVFCVVTQYNAVVGYQHTSMVLRNVGILTQHYTTSQPRRPRLEPTPSWKTQISRF